MTDIINLIRFDKQPDGSLQINAQSDPISSVMAREDIEIAFYQKAIQLLGYQWEEKIFNDHISPRADCMISITKSTSNQWSASTDVDALIWGRFPRQQCWRMAYNYVLELESNQEELNANTR